MTNLPPPRDGYTRDPQPGEQYRPARGARDPIVINWVALGWIVLILFSLITWALFIIIMWRWAFPAAAGLVSAIIGHWRL